MKQLNGKAKEKFESWFARYAFNNGFHKGTGFKVHEKLYNLPESMQWGVVQSYADSEGYPVNQYLDPTSPPIQHGWEILKGRIGKIHGVGGYDTRQEARSAAIEKLNQIINEG